MILQTTPGRLAVLVGMIVIAWLLVFVRVLPATVAASISFIVILYALAPMSRRVGRSRNRRD